MFGEAKSYIFFTYLKYILVNVIIFIGLIWLSQILRILELQHSITTQLFDVIKTTLLVLPSFISPLMPFLLILASFFLNYKFNSSNEIIILKQYFSLKNNLFLFLILFSGIFIFYFINNEYLSVKLYHKYKIQELEIRNNLKLGVPALNEFHIEEEVSIFFEKQTSNKFYNVEALIHNDGQFIVAENANIEIEKKNYNIIFNNGERIIFNKNEKSKTIFDKFIYSLENNNIEILMMDKEHFNTLQLLDKKEREFYYQGHNRIYQYFLTLVIIIISFKVFFLFVSKKNIFKYYIILFMSILVIQVINSYLIFLLNNNNLFNIYYYYIINIFILTIFSYFVLNFNENN
tara:strand:+ start:3140 stop:4177 length:1038 start_codon:yes stop_codon:yes gene_type:complete